MTTRVQVNVTPRQLEMIQHPAEVLWIGTGTKTGKTVGLELWLADGILLGEPTCWIGPWSRKTRLAYEAISKMLAYAEAKGDIETNDTSMRIKGRLGGGLECFTGDNPDGIYGEGFKRIVLDEATRQSELSFVAATTLASAVEGKIRVAFNLEKGAKNWAIRNLLRVKALSPEERTEQREDYMLFPTGDAPFVDPAYIARAKAKMPLALFQALFEAKIPESDIALFRNLDRVFSATTPAGPVFGHAYGQGVDLARKQDYTVSFIGDLGTGQLVDYQRFHEISWPLQYERVVSQYKRWGARHAWVDATGLGDVVVPELERRGMMVTPVVIGSRQSRRALIEPLVVACDNLEITAPPEWTTFRAELDAMEYELDDDGSVTYQSSGNHDDTVIAAALFVRGLKGGAFGPLIHAPGPSLREPRDLEAL